jgi:DNA ligase (NAD+)
MFKSLSKAVAAAFGIPSAEGQTFHPSQTCPECGTPLMQTTGLSEWNCPNLDCPIRIRGRIEHWCSPEVMRIPDCDAALIAKLVSRGLVRDVAELYRLKVAEIAAVEGMNQESARRIFDALTESQKQDGWRTLYGLSIPQLTPGEAKSLCRHFRSVDNVFAASADRLVQAEGVRAETARSIVHWHGDNVNRRLVKRLFKAGVNFKAEIPVASGKK